MGGLLPQSRRGFDEKKLVSALAGEILREIGFRNNQLALEETVHDRLKFEMEGCAKFISDDESVVRVVMQDPTERLFIPDRRNFAAFSGAQIQTGPRVPAYHRIRGTQNLRVLGLVEIQATDIFTRQHPKRNHLRRTQQFRGFIGKTECKPTVRGI